MARNKYPEETVALILDVAGELFVEKGYENTSIQDIIDRLDGLTKGAIYHHFKSKEAILMAVADRMFSESKERMAAIREEKGTNGAEKLRRLFRESVLSSVQEANFAAAPSLKDNPHLTFALLRRTLDEAVPEYILPMIEIGVADGSIVSNSPAELASCIGIMTNLWLNPMIDEDAPEVTLRKIDLFCRMMEGAGISIMDEETAARIAQLASMYSVSK